MGGRIYPRGDYKPAHYTHDVLEQTRPFVGYFAGQPEGARR